MQIHNSAQIFKSQPFRLPVKTITYNSEIGRLTKNVNWAREFSNPNAAAYYKKLEQARREKDIPSIIHWGKLMGEYKIVDLDKPSFTERIQEILKNLEKK